ncbi:hypothetical protein EWM64_g10525, partial [Hericium alpestre]
MSTFTSYAIAGVGQVGIHIAEELLKKKAAGKVKDIVLLTRSMSATLNRIFEQYIAQTGQKLDIAYRSIEELELAVKANPHDIPSLLLLVFAK